MIISRTLAGSVSLLTLAFACAPLSAQATGAAATQDCSAIADPTLRTACEQGPSSEVAGAQTIPGADDEASEEIIITGSRIRQTEFDAPNPVVSLDSANIQNAGTTNLTNFLQDIPALVGSSGSLDASGSAAGIGGVGLNLLNLRNLGVDRTLVLVDGRRHVAAVPGSSSVDVNTFPVDLIERVDVLTGAASAIYGADAVTGVVNFVLRRDFEGVQARLQAGTPAEGDATAYLGSLLVGKNFADGRGNIAVALEYGNEQALLPQDRRRFQPENFRGFYRNLADRNDDPNVPDFLPFADIRYFDSNPNGAIDVDLDFAPDFVGDGSVFDPGEYVPDIYQVGGSGTPVATYGGELIPNVERYVANVLLNYEFSDTVRAYAQGKYARVDSKSFGQPTFDFTLLVPLDNAYLPANVRDAAFAENGDFGVLVNRDNLDLGRRGERNRRETYRAVAGIVADLNDSTEVELSYVYGRSDVNSFQTNGRYNDRFFAAIDAVRDPATGNIVCRSSIAPATQSNQPFYNFQGAPFDFAGQPLSFTPGANSGCVPFNLFSQDQSQGALDFIRVDANDRSRLQQHVATIAMNGDLGDTVRLWGGPFSYALGAEY
ncbi:outer membrane receptor protein involved in Fe transport [Sphingomonas jejuensis]|uniref:Outer membrane receptor protein involved in Fe transport n=1 Tax=Sphingomonas jejuensis TaxID=904715 RepID=A0ABX0XJA3_9SPHN|nr:TonB-dependent receptor plug domain-containing protein [Sphingomonas jejuensis]NJC33418.1 outer membrane receptor protein involved in Fe transport [Sphingomonas jejuensis]